MMQHVLLFVQTFRIFGFDCNVVLSGRRNGGPAALYVCTSVRPCEIALNFAESREQIIGVSFIGQIFMPYASFLIYVHEIHSANVFVETERRAFNAHARAP